MSGWEGGIGWVEERYWVFIVRGGSGEMIGVGFVESYREILEGNESFF